jgi:hypothetical protein
MNCRSKDRSLGSCFSLNADVKESQEATANNEDKGFEEKRRSLATSSLFSG